MAYSIIKKLPSLEAPLALCLLDWQIFGYCISYKVGLSTTLITNVLHRPIIVIRFGNHARPRSHYCRTSGGVRQVTTLDRWTPFIPRGATSRAPSLGALGTQNQSCLRPPKTIPDV